MQNSNLKNDLLGQHNPVSSKEMELYLSGKLSAREARDVELKLNSDEFSSTAAEGFETYGAGAIISESGLPWKTKGSHTTLWVGLGVAFLTTVGIFMYNSDSSPAAEADIIPTETRSAASVVTEPEQKENTTVVIEETNIPPVTSITPLVKEQKEEAPVESSTEEASTMFFSPEMEREISSISSLKKKEGSVILDDENEALKEPAVRIRHYRNYKLVDQAIGLDQSMLTPILDGSPAFSETIVVNPKFPDWVPADSVYRVSMNEAIDWIISADYKLAKMRLERFIENESNDLSALFYLGYTLYLKGEFEEAIPLFNQVQSHLIQTFDHDSRFLEIKCLMQLGRDDEAKKEALHLQSVNSFYAEKALELVE